MVAQPRAASSPPPGGGVGGGPAVLVVAGATPGAGCTTLTAGLAAALRARGLTVQAFATGADSAAAALLEAATGRPVATLDTWLLGRRANARALAARAADAHVALVDGGGGPLDGAVPAPRRGGAGALQPLPAASDAGARRSGSAVRPSAGDDGGDDADDAASATTAAPASAAAADDDDGHDDDDAASACGSDAGDGSAAQLAAWLRAPLLLVADGGAPCRGLVALVKGCEAMVDDVWRECAGGGRGGGAAPPPPPGGALAGVVLNRAPTDGAARWLAAALGGARVAAPVLGALPADGTASAAGAAAAAPPPAPGSPAAAAAAARAVALGALVGIHVDVGAVLAAARRGTSARGGDAAAALPPPRPPPQPPTVVRVGLALDAACHDYAPSNLAALTAAGAALVPWSPLRDAGPPPAVALLLIGGPPPDAARARGLAANARARAAVAAFAAAGGVVVAEGGGLAYVATSLELTPPPSAAAAAAGPPLRAPLLLPMAAVFPFRCRLRPGTGGRKAREAPVEIVTTGAGGLLPRGLRARGGAARRLEVLAEAPLADALTGPATPLANGSGGGGGGGGGGGSGDDDGGDDDGEWGSGGDARTASGDATTSSAPSTAPWACAFTARRAAPGAPPAPEGYVRGRALATLLRLHYPSCPSLAPALLRAAAAVDVDAVAAAATAASDRAGAAAAAAAAAAPRSASADSWPAGGSPDAAAAAAGAAAAGARPLPRSASVHASPDRAGGMAAAAARAAARWRGADTAFGPSASVPNLAAWLPAGGGGSVAAPPSSDGGSERGGAAAAGGGLGAVGGGSTAGAWLAAAARRGGGAGPPPSPGGGRLSVDAPPSPGGGWASPPHGSPRRSGLARWDSLEEWGGGGGDGGGRGPPPRASTDAARRSLGAMPAPPPLHSSNVAAWRAAGDGVAALTPASVDAALALGLAPRLCGVPAGTPPAATAAPRATLPPPDPAAHAPIDPAWLAAERPALVVADGGGPLASAPCQDAAGRGAAAADAAAALSAAGLAAHGAVVLALAPACVADVFDGMLRLAAAAGCDPAAAAATVERLRARLRAVAAAGASLPGPRPTVAVLARPAAPVACGGWVPELVALAGGALASPPSLAPGDPPAPLAWDDLRRSAPSILVVVAPRRGGGRGGAPHAVAELAARPGWWSLPAVRAGAVFVIDASLLARPGPRLVDGAEALLAAVAAVRGGDAAGVPPPPPGALLKLALSGGQRCRPGLLGEYFRLWPSPPTAHG